MRLIDADALSSALYHEAFETDSDMQKWDGGCWIRYKMFENAIENAPTIEECKAGRWIEKDGWDGDVYYDCSACGESWTTIEGTPWDNDMNYCPHCGAKMEGGVQSEKEDSIL